MCADVPEGEDVSQRQVQLQQGKGPWRHLSLEVESLGLPIKCGNTRLIVLVVRHLCSFEEFHVFASPVYHGKPEHNDTDVVVCTGLQYAVTWVLTGPPLVQGGMPLRLPGGRRSTVVYLPSWRCDFRPHCGIPVCGV